MSFYLKLEDQYIHSLTFYNEDKEYFWYLITIIIDPPEAVKKFKINTEVRKPALCKINIPNNTNKTLIYKVLINGDYLSGDPTIEI